ncbi:unnamed protein product [Cladocopium goreaui]|uniref:Uncharacterized protein n=1 Tax=Cladocopium goreaui TaxID=2562237 RepID=A0A9P1DAJ4_9DINO|nr:unnamed protein product [Cladocopium goreaui]
MPSLRIVLVATCFASAFGGACTPVDSLYCPVNDVTEHADINKDVKLIKEPVLISAVYTGGSFSKGGGIMRTLQALAQKDMTVNGTPMSSSRERSGALDLYGSMEFGTTSSPAWTIRVFAQASYASARLCQLCCTRCKTWLASWIRSLCLRCIVTTVSCRRRKRDAVVFALVNLPSIASRHVWESWNS